MAEPLSPERLAEIREREQKATPGPWFWGDEPVYESDRSYVMIIEGGADPGALVLRDEHGFVGETIEDEEFIAHARRDVRDLLAEVDRLTYLHDLDHKLADHWESAWTELCNEVTENVGDSLPDGTPMDGHDSANVYAVTYVRWLEKAAAERDALRSLLAEVARAPRTTGLPSRQNMEICVEFHLWRRIKEALAPRDGEGQ